MTKYCIIIVLASISFKDLKVCNPENYKHKHHAIEVRDTDPEMGETFYRIYYTDTLVAYQSQYQRHSFVNQLHFDSSTSQMTSHITLISRKWKNYFFVFHQDSSYGYNYDPYRNSMNNLRLKVDSVVQFITGTNRWDSFSLVKPDSASWSKKNSELKEVFIFPKKWDLPTGRLIMYYSSKMNHLKKSFNKTADSTKRMKLFKTETFFNEFYSEKDKHLWPPSKITTEMREILGRNPEEINEYFKKYRISSRQID